VLCFSPTPPSNTGRREAVGLRTDLGGTDILAGRSPRRPAPEGRHQRTSGTHAPRRGRRRSQTCSSRAPRSGGIHLIGGVKTAKLPQAQRGENAKRTTRSSAASIDDQSATTSTSTPAVRPPTFGRSFHSGQMLVLNTLRIIVQLQDRRRIPRKVRRATRRCLGRPSDHKTIIGPLITTAGGGEASLRARSKEASRRARIPRRGPVSKRRVTPDDPQPRVRSMLRIAERGTFGSGRRG